MSDWFAKAFGEAAEDIRHKLIDEAWFGRRQPGHRSGSHDMHGHENGEPDRDQHHDHGIDR